MNNEQRELVKAYKEQVPSRGIYQLRNKENGKILVEKSANLKGSANSFLFKLDFYSNHLPELREDLQLYGPESFVFEILAELDSDKADSPYWKDELAELEKEWLAKLSPYAERGYNKKKRRDGSLASGMVEKNP